VPFILRKVRKARWHKHPTIEWLPKGELQGDALSDLGTLGGALSVWIVHDDNSNLEEVATAVASTGDSFSNFDYALLKIEDLELLGIKQADVKGETPYEAVNHWHRDLIQLTAGAVFRLATSISNAENFKRLPEKRVRQLLEEAAKEGRINFNKLSPSLATKLAAFRPPQQQ
jgi:hypothetical protein